MKKLVIILGLLILALSGYSQSVDEYRVTARITLTALDSFVWENDTIQHDSIIYADFAGDSIRVKYIDGSWSDWIKGSSEELGDTIQYYDTWKYGYDEFNNVVGLYKLKDNIINFAKTIGVSSLYIETDAGMVAVLDQAITPNTPYGDTVGYNFNVASEHILRAYAFSDGTGGIYDKRIEVDGAIYADTVHSLFYPGSYTMGTAGTNITVNSTILNITNQASIGNIDISGNTISASSGGITLTAYTGSSINVEDVIFDGGELTLEDDKHIYFGSNSPSDGAISWIGTSSTLHIESAGTAFFISSGQIRTDQDILMNSTEQIRFNDASHYIDSDGSELRYYTSTSDDHSFYDGAGKQATINDDGINIVAGNTYQIGGANALATTMASSATLGATQLAIETYVDNEVTTNVQFGNVYGVLSDYRGINHQMSTYTETEYRKSTDQYENGLTHSEDYPHGVVIHGDYMYVVTRTQPSVLMKFELDDLSQYTTLTFPSYAETFDKGSNVWYSSEIDSLLVAFTEDDSVRIVTITPDFTGVVSDWNIAYAEAEAESDDFTSAWVVDGDYIYLATASTVANTYFHKIRISDWSKIGQYLVVSDVSQLGHSMVYDGEYCWMTTSDAGTQQSLFQCSTDIGTGVIDSEVIGVNMHDDIVDVGNRIYVSYEDYAGINEGIIEGFNKDDLTTSVTIDTEVDSVSYALYFDGKHIYGVWVDNDPGVLVRLDPISGEIRKMTFPNSYNIPNEIISDGTRLFFTFWGTNFKTARIAIPEFTNAAIYTDWAGSDIWRWSDVGTGAGSMTNPMSTTGDIIYSSDNSGTPARLGVGTDAYYLKMVEGIPAWAAGTASGMTDPMTTRGDIIIRDATNTTAALNIGSNGQVLTSDGNDVSWVTLDIGLTNPMDAEGDMVYSTDGAGTPADLDIGASGSILMSNGTIPGWTNTITSDLNFNTGIKSSYNSAFDVYGDAAIGYLEVGVDNGDHLYLQRSDSELFAKGHNAGATSWFEMYYDGSSVAKTTADGFELTTGNKYVIDGDDLITASASFDDTNDDLGASMKAIKDYGDTNWAAPAGLLQDTSFTMTYTEFNALAGKVIVGNKGANTIIVPIYILLTWSGASGTSTALLEFHHSSGGDAISNILYNGIPHSRMAQPANLSVWQNIVPNASLIMTIAGGSSGLSAGTLKVSVAYYIVNI